MGKVRYDLDGNPRLLLFSAGAGGGGRGPRPAGGPATQHPPLSQQIRALETELDVQLFRRKPRGVELTQAGEALLAEARGILDRVEHAAAAARRTGQIGRASCRERV